jgi:hypothetical protein
MSLLQYWYDLVRLSNLKFLFVSTLKTIKQHDISLLVLLVLIIFGLPNHYIAPGVFFILFWMDSKFSIKTASLSFWRAIKMFIFTLPVNIIFSALYFFWAYMTIFSFPRYVLIILHFFVLILYTYFLVNVYTKSIKDQPSLYFEE